MKQIVPSHCWPRGRVAEINRMIHVGWKDAIYWLKDGEWDKKNLLGFEIGSVFESEGKGYVIDDRLGVCKNIYEWKTDKDLELLTKIPVEYQLNYRSAIGHQGSIYLVGGKGSDQVHCFDISRREWRPIKMHRERFMCSLAVIDDKLFVGGGLETHGADRCVECYLMKEEKWIDIKPTAREWCQLSSWNGKLLATGGWRESNCVEMYDELSGDWLPLPSINHGRHWHGACTTMNNEIVVVGGQGAFDSVEYLKL